VLDRYARELAGAQAVEGEAETRLWSAIEEMTPGFLAETPDGRVVRVSSTLAEVHRVMESLPGAAVARAGSGVTYGYLGPGQAWKPEHGWKACYEFGGGAEAWPDPGDDFAVMQQVKQMMDSKGLLNPGRYYGRF
jgi:FAD/FMN-containing dehydrogenase